MKIVSKPVEMIAWFKDKKIPEPLRFRIKYDDDSHLIIKVHKVLETREEKPAGIRSYVYQCQSIINGIEKIYELKFIIEDSKWILYKI